MNGRTDGRTEGGTEEQKNEGMEGAMREIEPDRALINPAGLFCHL